MKYVPGLMVGQLSGKAGSTVASRNKSGSYFRTRVIPKLVQNGKTTAVRSNFAYNSETYRTITPAQQQGWIALGAQIKKKNSIGVAYTLTGLQAFQSVNRVLSTLGLAAVVASPTLAQPEALTSLSATVNGTGAVAGTTVTTGASSTTQTVGSTANMAAGDTLSFNAGAVTGTVASVGSSTSVTLTASVTTTTGWSVAITKIPVISLAFGPSPIGSANYVMVYATKPLSAGVTRPAKRAFRLITVSSANAATPLSIGAAYVAALGSFPAGVNIFFAVKIGNSSGFESNRVDTFALSAAPI